jgi:hypothetical protein
MQIQFVARRLGKRTVFGQPLIFVATATRGRGTTGRSCTPSVGASRSWISRIGRRHAKSGCADCSLPYDLELATLIHALLNSLGAELESVSCGTSAVPVGYETDASGWTSVASTSPFGQIDESRCHYQIKIRQIV